MLRRSARLITYVTAVICVLLLPLQAAGLETGCVACHSKEQVQLRKPAAEPIRIRTGGRTRVITLEDAFAFRGHPCSGVVIAFLALRQGIQELWGGRIPDRRDMAVLSRTKRGGAVSVCDLVMGGGRSTHEMTVQTAKPGTGNFHFVIIDKSASRAVDIILRQDALPGQFMPLKKKLQNKSLGRKGWETLHGCIQEIIIGFPDRSPGELFEKPAPYDLIVW